MCARGTRILAWLVLVVSAEIPKPTSSDFQTKEKGSLKHRAIDHFAACAQLPQQASLGFRDSGLRGLRFKGFKV